MSKQGWFEVDRAGLAKLASRRNKLFILRELVQNAWDENSTKVSVEVHRPANGTGLSVIRVTDDSPEGFADLSHAFTLFAPSKKVGDATKRGRFNFGEKLVLALASHARIETTTGTVLFDRDEGRRRSPKKRAAGSMFEGYFRLNEEDRSSLVASAKMMLVPDAIATFVNGEEIFPRKPIVEFDAMLETEIARDDGSLDKRYRETKVRVFEVLPGEKASLFEIGIPVVETGDRWHVDVGQKVPLNLERENVPPNYLRDVRVAVANATKDLLTVADANAPWVRDALDDYDCAVETTKKIVELRFGEKVVVADPNDPEANATAVTHGYVVVNGSQLSSDAWDNVRKAGAIPAAGHLFPTPKPFSEGGKPLTKIAPSDWTPGMRRFSTFAREVAKGVLGFDVNVEIADQSDWGVHACYGSRRLIVNAGSLGKAWFEGVATEEQMDLLLHEYAHEEVESHLDHRYHEACTKLGARLARLALEKREVFFG